MDNLGHLALQGESIQHLIPTTVSTDFDGSYQVASDAELQSDILYSSIFFILLIVLIWATFCLLKKKFYIRSSVVIFVYLYLFWRMLTATHDGFFLDILLFSSNTLVPVLMATFIGLLVFGVYRLIREYLSSSKN